MAEKDCGLDIMDVSKIYKTKKGEVHALSHIDLQVHPCEFLSLLGTSGCGKSTLLRIICGLEKASQGRIRYGGRTIEVLLLAAFVLALPQTFAKNCSPVLPHSGLKFGTVRDAKL